MFNIHQVTDRNVPTGFAALRHRVGMSKRLGMWSKPVSHHGHICDKSLITHDLYAEGITNGYGMDKRHTTSRC